jgi:hypothetical protein
MHGHARALDIDVERPELLELARAGQMPEHG